jgi:hypothetical protein
MGGWMLVQPRPQVQPQAQDRGWERGDRFCPVH